MSFEETDLRKATDRVPTRAAPCAAHQHIVFWMIAKRGDDVDRARVAHRYLAMSDCTSSARSAAAEPEAAAVASSVVRRRRCFDVVVDEEAEGRAVRVVRRALCTAHVWSVLIEERGFCRSAGSVPLPRRGPSECVAVALLQHLGEAFVLRYGQEPIEATIVVTPEELVRYRAALQEAAAIPLAEKRLPGRLRSRRARFESASAYNVEWRRLRECDYVFCCADGAFTEHAEKAECQLYEVQRSVRASEEPTKLKPRAFFLYTQPAIEIYAKTSSARFPGWTA